MKTQITILTFAILFAATTVCRGQVRIEAEPVLDIGAIEADVVYHEEQFSYLTYINTQEEKLAALQQTITEQTAKIEEIERNIYKSLKEVDNIIHQAQSLVRAWNYIERIGNYTGEIVTIVGNDPALLVIANQTERALINRGLDLAQYLEIAITGGNFNLMNNSDRVTLINHVNSELSIMTGLCYTIKRQMLSAQRNGIFQEAMREYFGTIYRYQRNNAQLANRILQNFHF